jgi:hypothetical protein
MTFDFLKWLRALYPISLSAQMRSERLMVVPGTAEDFRATVCVL